MAENPIPRERLFNEQVQVLTTLAQAGAWMEISTSMFPLLPKPTVEDGRQKAFDTRTAYLFNQIEMQGQLIGLFSEQPEVQSLLNGRVLELKSELAEISVARFPNTKPVELSRNEEAAIHINRDANAEIQFYISLGETDALNPETIPALKYLKQSTILGLHIDALFEKLAKTEERKSKSLPNESMDFGHKTKSAVDKMSDLEVEIILKQIEGLSTNRTNLLKEGK